MSLTLVDLAKMYVALFSVQATDLGISKAPTPSNHDTESSESTEVEAISPAEISLLQKMICKGLVETTKDLEIPRNSPTSPSYSVKSFEALHLKPALLKGVYAMGFNAPSKIQKTALPTLLADPPQNMIAPSQSGTGKTATFLLAMLSRVDPNKNHPQVLCLSPTYELVIQTGEFAAKMSHFCPEIKLKYAVREEEIPRGSKITDHVIIGTAGQVLHWTLKFQFSDLI